ncbi:hypothetical protein M5689_022470 [Euphorbia peplus]|nr:hypothetical protein M5689_022470 [Euphorbia peplus]
MNELFLESPGVSAMNPPLFPSTVQVEKPLREMVPPLRCPELDSGWKLEKEKVLTGSGAAKLLLDPWGRTCPYHGRSNCRFKNCEDIDVVLQSGIETSTGHGPSLGWLAFLLWRFRSLCIFKALFLGGSHQWCLSKLCIGHSGDISAGGKFHEKRFSVRDVIPSKCYCS